MARRPGTVDARGASGSLWAGARCAATLGRWAAVGAVDTLDGLAWTMQAAIVSRDEFYLSHGGSLALVLDVGRAVWRWAPADLAFVVAGDAVTVTMHGPPAIALAAVDYTGGRES